MSAVDGQARKLEKQVDEFGVHIRQHIRLTLFHNNNIVLTSDRNGFDWPPENWIRVDVGRIETMASSKTFTVGSE